MKFLLPILASCQIFFGYDHRDYGVSSRRYRDTEGSGEEPGDSTIDSCCSSFSNRDPIYVFEGEATTKPEFPVIASLACLCEEFILSVKFLAKSTGLILSLENEDENLIEIAQSGSKTITVSTGSSYGISQTSSSVTSGEEISIEIFLETNINNDPELSVYLGGARIIKLETIELLAFQNIRFATSASSPVTFTEIKLQNAHNDEVAGDEGAENRFCSEDYPLRGESCSSCDGIWDDVNALCGVIGQHWLGSRLNGYCTDCSTEGIQCYCVCSEDYIQTWVKSEQPECTLNAIYCQECSVTSVQRGTSPPICEDSEDCLSPSGVCFESVSAYEVNLDGERRNVISLIYGCATQESSDLQVYFPREESTVITQSTGVIQSSVYYTDPNTLDTEEHILSSLEKNGGKDTLSCFECKVEYSLDINDPCATPKEEETKVRRCVLGSCESKILAIESSGRTFYFAERGCTKDPASSVLPDTPSQLFAASTYWPELPFVGINVYISTSIHPLGNDDTNYILQSAELFTCYKCQGSIMKSEEPKFDGNFFNSEIDNCWKPGLLTELDTCATECFTQFYAVTVDGNYQVEIGRGCARVDPELSVAYHGVDIISKTCSKDDGSLCNSKSPIEIGLVYQNTEILECYTCDTGLVSRDPLSSCFTATDVPVLPCPDSSYTKCRQETSVFQIEGITYYYGKRGCASLFSIGFADADNDQLDLGGVEYECYERSCNDTPGEYSVPESVNVTIPESDEVLEMKYTRFSTVMETVLENVKQATERFNENCYSLFTVYAVQKKSEIISCEVYNVVEVADLKQIRQPESLKQYYIDFGIRTRGEFVVQAENVVELKDSELETVAVVAKTSYAGLSILFPICPKIKIVQIIRHVFWIIMLLLVLCLTLGFAYCAPTYSSFYDNKKSFIDDELNVIPISGAIVSESSDVPRSCSIFSDSIFQTNSLFSVCIKADILFVDDEISATMFADPLSISCISNAEILLLCLAALLIGFNVTISIMAANSRSYFSKSIRVTTPFCDDEDLSYNNRSWWLSRPQTAISRSLRPWTARTIGTIPERPWTAESRLWVLKAFRKTIATVTVMNPQKHNPRRAKHFRSLSVQSTAIHGCSWQYAAKYLHENFSPPAKFVRPFKNYSRSAITILSAYKSANKCSILH
ncbi:Oidioi.mRNA.OKI2018_I69.chr2.g6825.t1.cds [Oikopleura dioica]|uniref:Oidioi.mRNA.OKI2018_I69.chr2.g6825.t1.cds n=1 Tax=Oikopleura dioica TaxID=34765 RepID=A0ABN7T4W9_OIKDI|nr:Oidioi.mRNA.OKI2018_I69.chr2.g6825.t1.cds [Oikopleura dioica]